MIKNNLYIFLDYICCLYGTPSVYGVVTMPFSVRYYFYFHFDDIQYDNVF